MEKQQKKNITEELARVILHYFIEKKLNTGAAKNQKEIKKHAKQLVKKILKSSKQPAKKNPLPAKKKTARPKAKK